MPHADGTDTGPGQAGAALVDDFHAVNAEVVALVEDCSDLQWQRRTGEEGWSLAAAGMHIAVSHLVITTWLHRLTSGLPVTETLDDFSVSNAYDADKYAGHRPDQIVDRLRLYGAAAEDFLSGLTAPELDRVARLPGLGLEAPVRGVVENVLIGHPRSHLTNIRRALADETGGAP